MSTRIFEPKARQVLGPEIVGIVDFWQTRQFRRCDGDHAGVPKGSFYNHFKSKDELGLEVLSVYWAKSEDMRAALRDSAQPPLDRIEAHLEAFSVTQSGCLVGNFTSEMANEPQFREALREVYESWIADFEACITEGQNDGSVRVDETAKVLAEFVVTALEGSVLKRKLEDDDQALVNFRKTMLLFLSANSASG